MGLIFIKLGGLYETIFIIFDNLMNSHTGVIIYSGYEMDFFPV